MESRVLDYGKSMYGGWYANYLINGKFDGVHGDTLREVKEKLKGLGFDGNLKNVHRFDND